MLLDYIRHRGSRWSSAEQGLARSWPYRNEIGATSSDMDRENNTMGERRWAPQTPS